MSAAARSPATSSGRATARSISRSAPAPSSIRTPSPACKPSPSNPARCSTAARSPRRAWSSLPAAHWRPARPASPAARSNISGTLSFAAGADYLDTIIDPNASEASVSGAVTLGGGTVAISPYSAVQTGTSYTILTDAAGGLGNSNTFSPAVSYEHLTGTLSYSNPDDVVLTFATPMGCATGRTPLPSNAFSSTRV